MTANVLTFRRHAPQPFGIACHLVVDPSALIEVGLLVAWSFGSCCETIFVDRYNGRSGRDTKGRFCRKGDPEELHLLGDWPAYREKDVADGITVIHGVVVSANNLFFKNV